MSKGLRNAVREYFPPLGSLADRTAYGWMMPEELFAALPYVLSEFSKKMAAMTPPQAIAQTASGEVYGYVLPGEFGPDGILIAVVGNDLAISSDDPERVERFERILYSNKAIGDRNAVLLHLWMDFMLMLSHYARQSGPQELPANRAQRRRRGGRNR